MGKSINFNNVKKHFLTVTLNDEDNTTLLVTTPSKGIFNELALFQELAGGVGEEKDPETVDSLYELTAKLMSRNKGNIKITKEHLEEIFDLEDIIIFFNAYMEFIAEISATKN